MKLTQAITSWFHKMFAWWPWRLSTQIEYAPHSSSLNTGSTQEANSKSIHEGITPQSGIASRTSTIQEWPERVDHPDVPAKNELSESSSSGPPGDGESTKKPATPANETPTTQQRLEFLQYLVKRGIVNEGLDDDK